MKIKLIHGSILFSILTVFNIYAQDSDILYRDIDEVVITGNRAKVNRSNVPMTISVVNSQEIEESSESALLPVLSERVPGLFVTQRGITGFGVAAGGSGGISIRGVGGSPTSQVLVLIDGHPQYMGLMGHHLPDAYVASDVERVEIIRGPASILYGSNAMGGAINIITRKQDYEGLNLKGRLMYGSHNTQKYMANMGIKKNRLSAVLSVNHDQTDGHRPNSEFNITNGYASVSYTLSDKLRIWGDASLASYDAQNPGTVFKPKYDNNADIIRGVASVTIENDHGKNNGAVKFFYNFGDHKINDGYPEGGTPPDYRYRSTDHNYGINAYQIFRPFKGNMITAGIDFKNYGGHAWNEFEHLDDDNMVDTSLYEIAGYAIMQQTLLNKLTLNAGLRLEHNEAFGNEWIPQAGLSFHPWKNTVIKASVAKGFRSPTIREMYMWASANPDLKPERMINYEVSVGQSFFNGILSADLTGYIADGSNQIKTVMMQNINVGEFKNTGIEMSFKWYVSQNLRIQGNYSYLHMTAPILYAPGQQAYLAVSYKIKKWTMSANVQYVHDLYSEIGDSPVKENYAQLNAKVGYRPLKWLDVFVKGENLTDHNYEIMYGYPMPGLTVFGGINLSFEALKTKNNI